MTEEGISLKMRLMRGIMSEREITITTEDSHTVVRLILRGRG